MAQTTTSTLVAIFDDQASAQRAARDLETIGLGRDSVKVSPAADISSGAASGGTSLTGRAPTGAETGGGIGGFFRSIFGSGEDYDRYSNEYSQVLQRGGTAVTVSADDRRMDEAIDILNRHGAVDIDNRIATFQGDTRTSRGKDRTEEVIPVVEERLAVGKRAIQRGGVRVHSHIVEKPVEEQVTLRSEKIHVERRPADRPATEADLRDRGPIEMTEFDEEAVAGKQARFVEEVHIGKEARQRQEKVRDSVRHTEVKVEETGGSSGLTDYDADFRKHFQSSYGGTGSYETYAPAYRYGYSAAGDNRYRGKSWSTVENDLRRDYERQYPESKWEQMKDSVRYGWDKMTGRA